MTTKTKAQKGKKKPTSAAERHKGHILSLKTAVGKGFAKWQAINPTATLADLSEFVEEVHEELSAYDEDYAIEDIRDELSIADQYLSEWEAPEPDQNFPITVGERRESAMNDLRSVYLLIGALSRDFPVSRLPKK
jgi:hypothetical protein